MRKTLVPRAGCPKCTRLMEGAVLLAVALLLALVGTGGALAESGGGSAVGDSGRPVEDQSPAVTDSAPTPKIVADVSDSLRSVESRRPPVDRVVVYYFHRTARCDNCLRFEAYASEALRDTFADELVDGRVEWRATNLDEPGNEHFVEDYELVESSLIVSRVLGGEEAEWRSLDAIWGLVGDKAAFMDYVSWEVGEELKKLDEPREDSPNVVPMHGELVPEPDGAGADTPPEGFRAQPVDD